MAYAVGEHVVPVDLPRAFVCRVARAHRVAETPLQVLELAPLAGPWPPDTRLVRGGDSVRPATDVEVAAARRARSGRRSGRVVGRHRFGAADRA